MWNSVKGLIVSFQNSYVELQAAQANPQNVKIYIRDKSLIALRGNEGKTKSLMWMNPYPI